MELEYEQSGGTVLDLGCLGPDGFRGWSGGARRWFAVTGQAATPGYLPGAIEAGEWQVMIGLHRVPADGVRYRVTARATRRGEGLLPPVPRRRRPYHGNARRAGGMPAAPAGGGSRATCMRTPCTPTAGLTVPELAASSRSSRGLDFLAVTDHNTVSHHAELPGAARRYGITLLPGQEVTTDGGHAGALGDIGWIDFRREPDDWLDATQARGGLLSVNHPFARRVSWTRPMRRRPPLAEVWHWSWFDKRWTIPFGWWLAWDPAAIPVGGSDWHRPGSDAPPGCPTTWVECDGSEPGDVLGGLRAGRVAISAERGGPVLLRHDGELVAVQADGTVLAGPDGPCARVRGDLARLPGAAGPHRLLDPSGATLALAP